LIAQGPFDADCAGLSQAGTHFVSFVAAVSGLWGPGTVVPATTGFVCEPFVPWHMSIAIFAAFGMSWLSAATRLRRTHDRAALMIHFAFFWIAPSCGFFPRAVVLGAIGSSAM
jgi:hypothetical protein